MKFSSKLAIALVSALAVASIVGSAALVVGKADQPRLAVTVKGVPGYVYYDRAYDLSIEYSNNGGAISGPVEIAVQLPDTFALAEYVGEASRRGERLTWTLDGLDTGERGSIPLTVQGVLPDDLTNAVYDLPGYANHTAFVEGFDLGVTLTAGDATASTLAVADTGTTGNFLVIVKDCGGATSSQEFSFFWGAGSQATPPGLPDDLQCGQASDPIALGVGAAGAALYQLREDVPDGWELTPLTADIPSCSVTGSADGLGIAYGQTDGVNFTKGAVTGNNFTLTCTFTNISTAPTVALTIVKACGADETSGPFEFTGTAHLADEDLVPAEFDGLSLNCGGESDVYELVAQGNYTLAETGLPDGWELQGVSCEVTGATGVVYEDGSPDPVTNGVRLMVPAAGAIAEGDSVVCTFTNAFIPPTVPLTIIKDCGDASGGPFTFTGTAHLADEDLVPAEFDGLALNCGGESDVYDLVAQGNYTLAEVVPQGWFFQGVSCEIIGATVPVYEDGSPDPVANGVRLMVPGAGAIAEGDSIVCTFSNTPLDPFKKYTDWKDKVVQPKEYFTWYIQVPASEETWTVTDYLPYGFRLAGPISAPAGVSCITFGYTGFECSGQTDTTAIIEVPVKAPDKCGTYKNRAVLAYEEPQTSPALNGNGNGNYADSYVKVDDCRRERGPRNPRANRAF